MKRITLIQTIFSISSIVLLITGIFTPLFTHTPLVSANGSFNSNLIQTDSIKPTLTADKQNIVSDVPLLSFLPFQAGNPRSVISSSSQIITFQLYYNNSGDSRIINPTAKVEVIKETDTRYRIKGLLSGSTGSVSTLTNQVGISANSETKGGDLVFSVPNNSDVNIVGNSTRIYRNALTAYPNYPNDLSSTDSATIISDNSQNNIISNPLFTSFAGKNITQSNGYKIGDTLDRGASNYGFIISKIAITSRSNNQNNAPTLNDQQITISRGTSSSFAPYSCEDKENNFPCTYTINNLPSFCTNNPLTRVISCSTNSQTPSVSTFTITPKDSTGLVGGIANFLINLTDSNSPNILVEKSCVKKDSEDNCDSINLTKGDQVTYKLEIKALGLGPIKNIRVVDTYNKDQLTDLTDIKPDGLNDNANGIVTFNLGDLNSGESKNISYNAKITDLVENGDRVVNTSKITGDNSPTQQIQKSFTINLPGQPNISTSFKSCFKKDTNDKCEESEVNPGDTITYKITVKNSGTGIAYNVRVVDTYDKTSYDEVVNANASGNIDFSKSTVNWEVGTVNGGETKELTFDAKVAKALNPGTEIVNNVVIKADTYPDQNINHSFILFSSANTPESPRTGGFIIWSIVFLIILGSGGYYYYKRNNKIGRLFVPHRSKEGDK